MFESMELLSKAMMRRLGEMSSFEREALNSKQLQTAISEHQEFQTAFQQGNCYLCNKPLTHFAPTKPCLHWLLRPANLKKKFILEVLEQSGAMRAQMYLRWVANEESFAVNINDLPNDDDQSKPIEVTVRYRNFEWSFLAVKMILKGIQINRFLIFIFK